MNKLCPQCGLDKPLTTEHFYRSRQTKSGFKPWCKICVNAQNKLYDAAHPDRRVQRVLRSRNRSNEARQRHVAAQKSYVSKHPLKYRDTAAVRRFGVSAGWLTQRVASNAGCCEICGVKHQTEAHPRFLSIDHCHRTGTVRGLVCGECNLGLGKFRDSPELLRAAATYLEQAAACNDN